VAMTTTDRLLRRTQRRLFLVTLALLAMLVIGVGAATLVIGTSALDADVDRALEVAVQAQVAALDGELPSAEEGREQSNEAPEVAGTTILVLDPDGNVVQRRGGKPGAGLPSAPAIDAAADGRDLRTITSDTTEIRVLTVPVVHDSTLTGYVQGAFDLRLHDRQSRSLVMAVLLVGTLGLLAAGIITLLVTQRALVPIREGFEAQRRFVADASHELRTPAALIRANAEVLQREGLVAEEGRELVEDVVAEADRLGGLVGDLLQLAAWDETRLVLTTTPLDVAAVARDTVRGATALAAERGVSLSASTTGPAPARADRARLVQLLLVLVDNAIDHSPAGGEIAVAVSAERGRVTVTVDDQGPGIPAADRERIFEPFTRLKGTTRHGSGGTGLGLAIARRIAEAHGGTITAGSTPAGGARFTVTLPSTAGQATA